MARKIRVQFPGAVYHVLCRGNRQEPIFKDDKDHEMFLDTLGEVVERTGWRIHSFVLMGNHYHLLIETPEPNLVDGMRWFQGTYTQRFNSRHKLWGHLFQGRYKALLVDAEGDYFSTVANYIHLNPARAKCFDFQQGSLSDFAWSSYLGYLRPRIRPEWLCVDRVLGALGLGDTPKGRATYLNYMKKRVLEISRSGDCSNTDAMWKEIRRGWVLGSQEFVEEMKEALEVAVVDKRRDSFMGEAVRVHDESEAQRLLQYGLGVCGLVEDDFAGLKKSDTRKKAIAWLLRRNTSVRNEWITSRLKMGVASNLARYIREVSESKQGELWELKQAMTEYAD
jgi:REP element-mobilizing transposase RayT